MNIRPFGFRWQLAAAVLLLSLAIIGCAAAAPDTAPGVTFAPRSEAPLEQPQPGAESQKLSSESPVVVMAPSQDPDRQKKLEALKKSVTETTTQKGQSTEAQPPESKEEMTPETSPQEPANEPATGTTEEASKAVET